MRTLRYGEHRDQLADLWLPAGAGPWRVVVSVHGGFFRPVHDRSLHDPLSAALVSSGVAVLNVEYRRTGSRGAPSATTEDVMTAVSALATSAPAGVALRPGTAVVGHSAGGYLALWAASHPDVELAVALAPVTDLEDCARRGHGGTAVPDWVGATPDTDPAAYSRLDLLRRLPTGTATVLVHGTLDGVVPAEHSRRYVDRAVAVGDPCRLVLLDGAEHFGVIEPGHPGFEAWRRVVVDWARD